MKTINYSLFKAGKISLIILFFLFFCFINIYAEKYNDIKKTITNLTKSLEKFISEVEKTEETKQLVKAIDSYAESIKKEVKNMQVYEEKYPELKDEDKELPKDIDDAFNNYNNLLTSERYLNANEKITKLAEEDTEIENAINRLNDVYESQAAK